MTSAFDTLWDEISEGKEPSKENAGQKVFSFDDLWSQVEKESPKKKTIGKQALGAAKQFALGAAESAALPYEIGTLPLATKGFHVNANLQRMGEDLEFLYENNAGKPVDQWSEKDKEMYQFIQERIQDPEKVAEESEPINIGIRSLAEKATGQDLQPEGFVEHAANWMGFIKDPKKTVNLLKSGITPSNVTKALAPSGMEFLRGIGAGTAYTMAENGELGPIGTMAAVVVGDLLGAASGKVVSLAKSAIAAPKETAAKIAASFTKPEKVALQQGIIKDFRNSSLQADLGTITDSNIIKWTQSRLAQSGLTGKKLDEFRKELTGQIKNEYKQVADGLGEARFASNHEAGEISKSYMKSIRDKDLLETRNLYHQASKSLKNQASVDSKRLANALETLENKLKPGQLKSTEQSSVLKAVEQVKRDIVDSQGNLLYAKVEDLMNNKIALNDIINYEVQGGSKQLLKGIVSEIDRAIISHGKDNPRFAKEYINANKRFSQHAKTFRNKSAEQIFKSEDPSQLINKLNTVQGIRNLKNILGKTPEGTKVFEDLKRFKLDRMIGDNLVDSTSQQAKLGTFSKLLQKGKNAEIAKEMLGPLGFARLKALQKNAGVLADAAEKFYNASKSGAVAADAAILATALKDISNLLMGNPWPIAKVAGTVLGARKLSGLMADPQFLKMVEDVILANKQGSQKLTFDAIEKLKPYVLSVIHENDAQPKSHQNTNTEQVR